MGSDGRGGGGEETKGERKLEGRQERERGVGECKGDTKDGGVRRDVAQGRRGKGHAGVGHRGSRHP